jgi:hypothetical protein
VHVPYFSFFFFSLFLFLFCTKSGPKLKRPDRAPDHRRSPRWRETHLPWRSSGGARPQTISAPKQAGREAERTCPGAALVRHARGQTASTLWRSGASAHFFLSFLVFQLAIGSGEQRVTERLLCRSDLGMHKIDSKQNVQTKEEDQDQRDFKRDLNSKLRCRKDR